MIPEEPFVRLLPTQACDMVPSAVRWAQAVHTALKAVPRQEMLRPARESLSAVTWVLAAAADFEDRIPPAFTAEVLAREAGVGARVWQKRTAWLREHGWLEHAGAHAWSGWQLRSPGVEHPQPGTRPA
ncbi:hypothetical protein [Kineococcus arenarius]|uniref:hypothetical protein n=1 Tax=Kineococcus sp. SYSU DK007 TaxID=3383128 RepID=UPI003D7D2051